MANKGYHSNEVLRSCTEHCIRSYILERQGGERTWAVKDEQTKASFHGNGQRMKRSKGKNTAPEDFFQNRMTFSGRREIFHDLILHPQEFFF